MRATVNANVALIKSIPQQYLHQVEGMVMRSVQEGRNLGDLSKDLQKQFGVTKRRAALIARDQNNKATAALSRVRQLDLGIEQAIWMHSGAGKHPRPTHVRNNGKKYNIAKGWFDPAVKRFIHPGTEIDCRCVSRPVIPGFS
jgi:SPP1 gp7 family putative phage head morphogenesis protein